MAQRAEQAAQAAEVDRDADAERAAAADQREAARRERDAERLRRQAEKEAERLLKQNEKAEAARLAEEQRRAKLADKEARRLEKERQREEREQEAAQAAKAAASAAADALLPPSAHAAGITSTPERLLVELKRVRGRRAYLPTLPPHARPLHPHVRRASQVADTLKSERGAAALAPLLGADSPAHLEFAASCRETLHGAYAAAKAFSRSEAQEAEGCFINRSVESTQTNKGTKRGDQ